MSRHTPAPWKIVAAGSIQGPDGKSVCAIAGTIKRSRDEKAANARLIAAAPELLAALARLEELAAPRFTGPNGECPGLTAGEQAIIAARAAIAKATEAAP